MVGVPNRYAQQQKRQEQIEMELFRPRTSDQLSFVDLLKRQAHNHTILSMAVDAGFDRDNYEKAAVDRVASVDKVLDDMTMTPAARVKKLSKLQKEFENINGQLITGTIARLESVHNSDEAKINARTAQQIQDSREIRASLRNVPENELLEMARQSSEMAAALCNMNRFVVGTHKGTVDNGNGGKDTKTLYGMQESTQNAIKSLHIQHVLGSEGANAYMERGNKMSDLLMLMGKQEEHKYQFAQLHSLAENV